MSQAQNESNPQAQHVDLSSLFTRRFKHCNREVSRPMWFYVSLNKNGFAATRRLIIEHGGKVTSELGDKKTSREICLVDPQAKASQDGRRAYSVDYVQSCITAKSLLNIEDFRIPAVGRRRTPSKKIRPAPRRDSAAESGEKQTGKAHPARAKDSEVTDDLPCIAGLESEDQNYEGPATNAQMTITRAPDETLHQGANGTNRKTSTLKGVVKGGETTSEKTAVRQLTFVTPKKRMRPEEFLQVENEARRSNASDDRAQTDLPVETPVRHNVHDKLTQADIPPADPVRIDVGEEPTQAKLPITNPENWSRDEDNEITQLCIDAKQMYQQQGREPSKVFTRFCWRAIEKAGLLPAGRSAEACFARAKELWQNGDAEDAEASDEIAEAPQRVVHASERAADMPNKLVNVPETLPTASKRNAGTGNDAKRARLSSPPRADEDEDEMEADRGERQAPRNDKEDLPNGTSAVQQQPKTVQDASRRETRDYIVEMVARIAERGKVTKRRAFRALREERGHWKRALRLVCRRKGSSAS